MAQQKLQPANGKAAWAARSDRGPHTATLPSGQQVQFLIPDSNALIRADRLPDELTEIAIMASAYPDGADGYMGDLAVRATTDQAEMSKLKTTIKQGLELREWLVAHMLVEPEIDPEDVASLPPGDVSMLLEFAERKRDTDSVGVRLPIVMLEVYARFRDEQPGAPNDDSGGREDSGVPEIDDRLDGLPV